jgi:hypothetical protein
LADSYNAGFPITLYPDAVAHAKKLVDSDEPLILNFDEKRRQLLKSHSPRHQHLELVKSLAKLKEDLG